MKDRLSNFELLRLISMLMVLNLHSFCGYDSNHSIFQVVDFFRESTSICAVNVFLIISGYFGIKWKIKSFYNLIFQIFFYSFGVYFITITIGAISFSTSTFAQCFKALYASWFFITCYIALYIISPVLNSFAEFSSKRRFFFFIILFYCAQIFICRETSIFSYFLCYLIGRFISKTDADKIFQINACFSYWIVTCLISIMVLFLYLYGNVTTAVQMCHNILGYSYLSPLVLLQAIFIFLSFSRLKIQNRFINWISASSLSIFLIHMHPAIKNGFYSITESFYNYSPIMHFMLLSLFIVIVFFGSVFIDKIRILFSDNIYLLLCRIMSHIPHKQIDYYIPQRISKML